MNFISSANLIPQRSVANLRYTHKKSSNMRRAKRHRRASLRWLVKSVIGIFFNHVWILQQQKLYLPCTSSPNHLKMLCNPFASNPKIILNEIDFMFDQEATLSQVKYCVEFISDFQHDVHVFAKIHLSILNLFPCCLIRLLPFSNTQIVFIKLNSLLCFLIRLLPYFNELILLKKLKSLLFSD